MIIIGVDPDTDKHGVAFYNNGHLESLEMLDRNDLILTANRLSITHQILFAIEDNCSVKPVFGNKIRKRAKVNMEIARRIGMLHQAQTELMRDIERNNWEYKLFRPSSMWKRDRVQFERVTGWTGQSNEDTRSAAYFGYLGCK